jgi:hypothetical protein
MLARAVIAKVHNRAWHMAWRSILVGAGHMIIDYPRGPVGSLPWFVFLMVASTLIGFGCMTLMGLL